MGNKDQKQSKQVSIAMLEAEGSITTMIQNIAMLKDFPRITQRQYVINKTEQHKAIWGDLLGSKGRFTCDKDEKDASIVAGLFWISQLFHLLALVLSYSKETMSGSAILNATLLEILFAMVGVLLACYKQWREWITVTSQRDSALLQNEHVFHNSAVHMSGFIIASNMAGCSMLFCGFILLYFFDQQTYTFLKSMVYFTGLTIFALSLVDNIIMAKLKEGKTLMENDQMKLLLHEVKEELFEELQMKNKYERVKVLRDFINKSKIFRLKPKSYIYPI